MTDQTDNSPYYSGEELEQRYRRNIKTIYSWTPKWKFPRPLLPDRWLKKEVEAWEEKRRRDRDAKHAKKAA